jgi:redox-sensitive bicupin YhaK (pirin superfamily)
VLRAAALNELRAKHRDISLGSAAPVAETPRCIACLVSRAAALVDGTSLSYHAKVGRRIYLHVVAGRASLGSERLMAGDAAFIEGEPAVIATTQLGAPAEVLLFDLR